MDAYAFTDDSFDFHVNGNAVPSPALDIDDMSDVESVDPSPSPTEIWFPSQLGGATSQRSVHSNAFHSTPLSRSSGLSFGELLLRHELPGGFWPPQPPPSMLRRSLGALGVLSRSRLNDIASDSESIMRSGHVFLGFTQDDRFLISYTTEAPRSWMFPLAVDLFPGELKDGLKLHFWRFSPFPKQTKIARSVALFRKATQIPFSVKLCICQWPHDDRRIIVIGYWDEAEPSRFRENSSERQIMMSVIHVPCSSKDDQIPDIHSDIWLTEAPHPIFHPEHCAVVPNLLILHGGGLLLLYHLLENGQTVTDLHRLKSADRRCNRKRLFSDLENPFHEKQIVLCEEFDMDTDEAIIREVFYENGSSQLIDKCGRPLPWHALQEMFRHSGRPVFFPESKDARVDHGVVVAALRIDILMEKAWSYVDRFTGDGRLYRSSYTCSTDSVSVVDQELVLKACYFITKISHGEKDLPYKSRSRLRSIKVPFLLHLNYITGDCRLRYYGNKVEETSDQFQKSEVEKHRIMDELLREVERKWKRREVFGPVHTMDNHNVDKEVSLDSLETRDGCLSVML